MDILPVVDVEQLYSELLAECELSEKDGASSHALFLADDPSFMNRIPIRRMCVVTGKECYYVTSWYGSIVQGPYSVDCPNDSNLLQQMIHAYNQMGSWKSKSHRPRYWLESRTNRNVWISFNKIGSGRFKLDEDVVEFEDIFSLGKYCQFQPLQSIVFKNPTQERWLWSSILPIIDMNIVDNPSLFEIDLRHIVSYGKKYNGIVWGNNNNINSDLNERKQLIVWQEMFTESPSAHDLEQLESSMKANARNLHTALWMMEQRIDRSMHKHSVMPRFAIILQLLSDQVIGPRPNDSEFTSGRGWPVEINTVAWLYKDNGENHLPQQERYEKSEGVIITKTDKKHSSMLIEPSHFGHSMRTYRSLSSTDGVNHHYVSSELIGPMTREDEESFMRSVGGIVDYEMQYPLRTSLSTSLFVGDIVDLYQDEIYQTNPSKIPPSSKQQQLFSNMCPLVLKSSRTRGPRVRALITSTSPNIVLCDPTGAFHTMKKYYASMHVLVVCNNDISSHVIGMHILDCAMRLSLGENARRLLCDYLNIRI
jgi:hypothetical protein